jgi:quinol monooxygenase YgiN
VNDAKMTKEKLHMIVLTAKYHVQPGKVEEVEAALKRMAPLVAESEPGCSLYQVSRSQDNTELLLLYEVYADEEAIQAHRETPHFKEIIEGIVVPLLLKRERELFDLVIG